MYKKYTIPVSIFVVFENLNPILWTSQSFGANNYLVFLNKIWLVSLNVFFRNEIFLSNSTLLENSAVDNKNNNNFLKKVNLISKNRLLIFYIYYFFSLKSKICLFTFVQINPINTLASLDQLYKSANWLERETSEMFKISFLNKTDTRRLLLDYSKHENPLLKDFPTEGFNDVFYSFFEDQVIYNTTTVVEL